MALEDDLIIKFAETYGLPTAFTAFLIATFVQGRKHRGPSLEDRLNNAERDAAEAARSSKANGKRLDSVDSDMKDATKAISDLSAKIARIEGKIDRGA